MELRQLQCLVTCAQAQSFSKAASILFTSQSNVSKTIASLEQELGKKLFERKQHGIELTEKGKQIYTYALSMLECSAKIIDCAEEEAEEELRISFQPSSWFAAAFCAYYQKEKEHRIKYRMIAAAVDDILHRISNDIDQIGFAYIEEKKLKKMQEMFRMNHIGYYELARTKTVLYCGDRWEEEQEEILLIQGNGDDDSWLKSWKSRAADKETTQKFRVVINTNSDYIMQTMLKHTELSNIRPAYLSHSEESLRSKTKEPEIQENTTRFVCLFKNDKPLDTAAKHYLNFIRQYITEK